MFVNRLRELEFLHKSYNERKPHFIVLYGKRRVGKTELVKQFFRNTPHIYFLADKTPEREQLRSLSEKTGLLFGDDFLVSRGFGTWYEFFAYIKGKGRTIVVIDEFPFLIETNRAIPSIFQKGWEEHLKDSDIFLIILGSSMGMMETEVLGHKSPLFGRRTAQVLVEPFDFRDAAKFFPGKSVDELIYIYAVVGGVPAYLLQFDPLLNLWDNIRQKILTPEAYLYDEPEFILREELREPRNYFAILKAVSMGKARVSEIINETGFEKNVVGKYLSVLTDLRIVRRDVPVTETIYEKSKKGIYTVDDNYFKYWFHYVFPNRSFIQEGNIDYVIEKKIKPTLDIFTSQAFEDICRDYVRKGRLQGLMFNKTGRWWSKHGEIDVLALHEEEGIMLCGEAKWSIKKVGIDVLDGLKKKSDSIELKRPVKKRYYALFSRKGFTDALKKIAENEKEILLVDVPSLAEN